VGSDSLAYLASGHCTNQIEIGRHRHRTLNVNSLYFAVFNLFGGDFSHTATLWENLDS
jgi:hypothetical protein